MSELSLKYRGAVMSIQNKLRVAVIGCGMFATSQYLPNISREADAETVAAVDIDFGRAETAARRFGIPNTPITMYTSWFKSATSTSR